MDYCCQRQSAPVPGIREGLASWTLDRYGVKQDKILITHSDAMLRHMGSPSAGTKHSGRQRQTTVGARCDKQVVQLPHLNPRRRLGHGDTRPNRWHIWTCARFGTLKVGMDRTGIMMLDRHACCGRHSKHPPYGELLCPRHLGTPGIFFHRCPVPYPLETSLRTVTTPGATLWPAAWKVSVA